MRVLIVTNDYPPKPGGIQQYLGNIVDRHQGPIRVLAPAHPGAPDDARIRRGARAWMAPTPAVRRWIVDEIHDFVPDAVVYGAPTPLAQIGAGIRRATGIPFAVMTHGAEVTLPARVPGLRRMLRQTFRAADGIFAVSRFTAARVRAVAGVEVTVLGAGVDVEFFSPAAGRNRESLTIGCVSRFIPRKGHRRVIAAAERLAGAGRAVDVLLVGKGRLESRIRRRAARAAIPVRLEVGIPWRDLPDAYRRMDVFVMPARSRWWGLEVEGLGIVYLEAAATGLPVVAGPSGGAPETITPGQTGYVAATVPHIVEAVERILDRPDMGPAARAAAEAGWTWEVVMRRWHDGLAALV